MKLPKLKSWEVNESAALTIAAMSADTYNLPQTVYRTKDTCGWVNTNCLAPVLENAEMLATVLPGNYFN